MGLGGMYAVFDVALAEGVSCSLRCVCFGGWRGSDGLRMMEGWDFGFFLPVISCYLFHLAQRYMSQYHFLGYH